MQLPIAVVDVFTSEPFAGNQLGVVRVPHPTPLSKAQEQAIAREFNYSETVFVHDAAPGEHERRVAIWTPFAELPFAGHPTIGTLCYIAQEEGAAASQSLHLRLLAGPVSATYDGATRRAEAQVPHDVRVHAQSVPMAAVLDSQPKLRAAFGASASGSCPLASIVNGMTFILVELPSLDQHLAAAAVTPVSIDATPDQGWESKVLSPFFYVVTSHEPNGGDGASLTKVCARMIEPRIGEDPATGSACCTLSAYLALQRGGPDSVHVFELKQGVEMGRPSSIGVKVELDSKGTGVKSVLLSGSAVVTMRGTLDV